MIIFLEYAASCIPKIYHLPSIMDSGNVNKTSYQCVWISMMQSVLNIIWEEEKNIWRALGWGKDANIHLLWSFTMKKDAEILKD